MTFRTSFATTFAGLLATSAATGTSAQTAPAETPANTLTGNVAVVSDDRFRGISQSYRLPAVQGGFDFTHAGGFYLGNWNSSVSGNSYNNGASLEMDLYGGDRFDLAKDLAGDVGALFYVYPGARLNRAPGVSSDKKYDNAERYAGVTSGPFNAEVSYAVTDDFGLTGETAACAYFSALPDNGNSKLPYTDLKVSLNKEWASLNVGAAVVGTDGKKDCDQVATAGGVDAKRIGTNMLVLSVGKTF